MELTEADGLFVNAQSLILEALSESHSFDLSRPLTVSEAQRLQSFVELCESPDRYPKLTSMDKRLFCTARSMIRTKLAKSLAE